MSAPRSPCRWGSKRRSSDPHCWPDDDLLQPADRIQVIAGPDHPHGGCACFAVIAVQVATHGSDESLIGKPVIGKLLARLSTVGEARGEVLIPLLQDLARDQKELYPEVVDAREEEGGVPSRLTKTDRRKAGKEGTPCQMFAGSPSGRTTKRSGSRSMTSLARVRVG